MPSSIHGDKDLPVFHGKECSRRVCDRYVPRTKRPLGENPVRALGSHEARNAKQEEERSNSLQSFGIRFVDKNDTVLLFRKPAP